MKKLKTFFYSFKNSILSTEYYKDIIKANVNFSIKYFVILSFFASVITVAYMSVTLVPKIMSEIKFFYQEAENIYPDDLTIEFKDGSWTANKEEPIFIKSPNLPAETDIPSNLVVFDKNGTIDKMGEYDTLAIVNSENILYGQDAELISSQSLKNIPNGTLNKEAVKSKIASLGKFLNFLPWILPIFLLIPMFLFGFLGGSLFNILLAGIALYIALLLNKRRIDFKSAFQISVHSATVPVLIRVLLTPFPEFNNYIPGWFLAMTIGIALFFGFKMEKSDLKKIEGN